MQEKQVNKSDTTLAIPRMDRTKFKSQSLVEADHQLDFWITKSRIERLAAAAYLNSVAWGYDLENPPRMNKTVFSVRKQNC